MGDSRVKMYDDEIVVSNTDGEPRNDAIKVNLLSIVRGETCGR